MLKIIEMTDYINIYDNPIYTTTNETDWKLFKEMREKQEQFKNEFYKAIDSLRFDGNAVQSQMNLTYCFDNTTTHDQDKQSYTTKELFSIEISKSKHGYRLEFNIEQNGRVLFSQRKFLNYEIYKNRATVYELLFKQFQDLIDLYKDLMEFALFVDTEIERKKGEK